MKLVLASLFLLASVSVAEHVPNLAVAISTDGLQFFGKLTTNILKDELPKISIPQFAVPINSGPGSGNLYLDSLNIADFEAPTIQFGTEPPYIKTQSNDGNIKIAGNWKAEYLWWTTWNFEGTLDVSVTDLKSEISFNVYGEDGYPQVEINSCGVDVQNVDVSISGGGIVGWITSYFFGSNINAAALDALNNQVCLNLETQVVERLNKALRSKPKRQSLGRRIFVDYDLLPKPIQATNTHIFAQGYADVVFLNRSCQIPNIPLHIGNLNDTFMSTILVAESIPNCMLQSAHKADYLHFVLTRDIDKKLETFLSTNCSLFQACVGKFFPKLATKYPGRHIQMEFYSASVPTVSFTEKNGIVMKSGFFVYWKIQPESGKEYVGETLAQLHMNLLFDVKPTFYKQRLSGDIISINTEFTENFSKIGNFSNFFLKTMDFALDSAIRIGVEKVLQKGIQIPLLDGVELANETVLSVEDGAIRCNANFIYVDSWFDNDEFFYISDEKMGKTHIPLPA